MSDLVPQRSEFPRLLPPRVAAERLGTTAGTLAAWRCRRSQALPYVRVSRKIFYREQDIADYINSRIDPGVGAPQRRNRKTKKSSQR